MTFNYISTTSVVTSNQNAASTSNQTNLLPASGNVSDSVKESAANLDNLIRINQTKLAQLAPSSVDYLITNRRLQGLLVLRQQNPTPITTNSTASSTKNTSTTDSATLLAALKAAHLPANIFALALSKLGITDSTTSNNSNNADLSLDLVGGGTLTLGGTTGSSETSGSGGSGGSSDLPLVGSGTGGTGGTGGTNPPATFNIDNITDADITLVGTEKTTATTTATTANTTETTVKNAITPKQTAYDNANTKATLTEKAAAAQIEDADAAIALASASQIIKDIDTAKTLVSDLKLSAKNNLDNNLTPIKTAYSTALATYNELVETVANIEKIPVANRTVAQNTQLTNANAAIPAALQAKNEAEAKVQPAQDLYDSIVGNATIEGLLPKAEKDLAALENSDAGKSALATLSKALKDKDDALKVAGYAANDRTAANNALTALNKAKEKATLATKASDDADLAKTAAETKLTAITALKTAQQAVKDAQHDFDNAAPTLKAAAQTILNTANGTLTTAKTAYTNAETNATNTKATAAASIKAVVDFT